MNTTNWVIRFIAIFLFAISQLPGDFNNVLAKEATGTFNFKKPPKSVKKRAKKPSKNRQKTPAVQTNSHDYDGTYLVVATRTFSKNSFVCFTKYNMTLEIRNGKATYKFPFGSTLHGRVRGNNIYVESQREASGGRWIGKIRLSTKSSVNTTGYFNWEGDDDLCKYKMSASKT
jgi:hypothetical protein